MNFAVNNVREDAHDLTSSLFHSLFKKEKYPLQFQTLSFPNKEGQDYLEYFIFQFQKNICMNNSHQ